MKAAIQQRARELGFDDCRFTTAAPPVSGRRFEGWLAAQRHGEMGYLARNAAKRVDPQAVLSGAKSIITLAVAYGEGGGATGLAAAATQVNGSPLHGPAGTRSIKRTTSPQPSPPLRGGEGEEPTSRGAASRSWAAEASEAGANFSGVVARYARHADYHAVIGEKLRALTEFVNHVGGDGTRSLWYVDTGPLLERDLAQRAGLGFIGKHTNLISRRLGNWIFLSEIITTLELAPDEPEKNRCGSCSRCIVACPTAAITAPFELDARRCISYLTIELKGAIPEDLRPAVGNRIYGCDDCLAACPWNRFARESNLMKAHARPDLTSPALLDLLALDEDGFKRRFAGTPILRTKRRGLLRNVCVALGNVGDVTALPALERAARDEEALIAEHARWAVGRILRKKTL